MTVWTAAAISAVKSRFQGSSIVVDTNRMVTQANTVSVVITDMERTFQEIQRIVGRTSGYWVGEAGDHHRRMFDSEKDNITRILIRLKEHPEDLILMANNFETTELNLTEINHKLRSDYI